jgi:arginine deiminase
LFISISYVIVNLKKERDFDMSSFIDIQSETGKLESVLLHRPGKELERIVPNILPELLFEDIPWLRKMKQEHDNFAEILRNRGTTVYYIDDLLADILENPVIREKLIREIIENNPSTREYVDNFIIKHLLSLDCDELVENLIAGIQKEEIDHFERHFILSDYIQHKDPYHFYVNPLPNLYFMRDPATIIHQGISLNAMQTFIRKRESIYLRYIYENHPLFEPDTKNVYFDDKDIFSIEGGDILILSPEVVAIGCSQRTQVQAAEKLAQNLLKNNEKIEKVLAIDIPKKRAFMHLDTVFTMVDIDKFTIYPGIINNIEVVTMSRNNQGFLHYEHSDNLKLSLEAALGIKDILLIESGGGNPITAAREQWNDSTNTLAIAPGVVIAYGRNESSNRVLMQHGIEVIEIDASELVRGRGGPRCMSMPLKRSKIS